MALSVRAGCEKRRPGLCNDVPQTPSRSCGNSICRHQVFAELAEDKSTTIRTPLYAWFLADLMTTDNCVSALLLQRQLALQRYKTTWMMLHNSGAQMVSLTCEPLLGEVEDDDRGLKQLPMAAFQTLLGLGAWRSPRAYNEIRVPPIFRTPTARYGVC